ncbi:MAG: hypothetical protein ACI807_002937 [Paracoccaceae bacterium]|jgi:hypothetical protein
MTTMATVLGVSRFNLAARLTGKAKPRRRYQKAQDLVVLLVIFALMSRQLCAEDAAFFSDKRV